MNTVLISVFLMKIKLVLTGFFSVFLPSQVVIIVVASNKRQKCPSLKDTI